MGLRSGGPLAIVFSLVCIGLAAFSFLVDFDSADQMIRAGAPEKAAWGVALGLTVTLVWLAPKVTVPEGRMLPAKSLASIPLPGLTL